MPWLLRCRLSSVNAPLFSDEKKARTCRAEEVCSCVPTTNTGQWWPNGPTIAQDRQRPQTAKKKAPAGTGLVGAKVAIHEYPSQGASKDGHLHSVRPVCGGSAKPCPAPQFSGSGPHASKRKGPERQSGARLAMMPTRKDGHRQPQPAPWRKCGAATTSAKKAPTCSRGQSHICEAQSDGARG
jgi:hypothetical protein